MSVSDNLYPVSIHLYLTHFTCILVPFVMLTLCAGNDPKWTLVACITHTINLHLLYWPIQILNYTPLLHWLLHWPFLLIYIYTNNSIYIYCSSTPLNRCKSFITFYSSTSFITPSSLITLPSLLLSSILLYWSLIFTLLSIISFTPSPKFTVQVSFFTPSLHLSLIFIYSIFYLVLNYLLNLSWEVAYFQHPNSLSSSLFSLHLFTFHLSSSTLCST
jgi:hypothetical protein